jgi:hypothetical protein
MATIMQICASPSWGGMEMHVGFLSTHLAKRGHTIIPACYPGSPLQRDLQKRGFTRYGYAWRLFPSIWHQAPGAMDG